MLHLSKIKPAFSLLTLLLLVTVSCTSSKTIQYENVPIQRAQIELTEEDTSIILLYGEDATRPLMDRVYNFAIKISKEVSVFDTRTVELPVDEKYRQYLSPLVIYTMLERFSCHLEKERNHPLTTRRFYRQLQY